nr:9979_t:CDS:2 [Entrophospora candida]
MDTGSFEIIITIWAFVSLIIGVVKKFDQYCTTNDNVTGTYTIYNHEDSCDLCCPCQMLDIITAGMSRSDDTVLSIVSADWSFFSETINNEELDNANNFAERLEILSQVSKKYDKVFRIIKATIGCFAIPVLVSSFEKGLDNEAIMTRVFTFGAPILQELGINLLALILYTVMIPMITFQISRTIANKLEDKIQKVFIISIITIRIFDPPNMIWAIKGVNTLEPGVPFWKPF